MTAYTYRKACLIVALFIIAFNVVARAEAAPIKWDLRDLTLGNGYFVYDSFPQSGAISDYEIRSDGGFDKLYKYDVDNQYNGYNSFTDKNVYFIIYDYASTVSRTKYSLSLIFSSALPLSLDIGETYTASIIYATENKQYEVWMQGKLPTGDGDWEVVSEEERVEQQLEDGSGTGGTGVLGYAVAANPVPEPATMLLLGSGLVGLAGFRKKFKKA